MRLPDYVLVVGKTVYRCCMSVRANTMDDPAGMGTPPATSHGWWLVGGPWAMAHGLGLCLCTVL